jgi:hypothetical protein
MRNKLLRRKRRFHLDHRVEQLLAEPPASIGHNNPPPDDDVLLSTEAVGAWLGVSTQWLEIGRVKGYGPEFVRLGPRNIRYRCGQVRAFLRERVHVSTAGYSRKSKKEVA